MTNELTPDYFLAIGDVPVFHMHDKDWVRLDDYENLAAPAQGALPDLSLRSPALPELPKPDTHCYDEDTRTDVWSHSAEQMHAYAKQYAAAIRAQQYTDSE